MKQQDSSSTAGKRKFRLNAKVELLPAFLNLPFVGLILVLLFSNAEHWALLNNTISSTIGITLNWVVALIALISMIGIANLAIIIIGIIKLKWIYLGKRVPYLLLFPALTITIMFIGLTVLMQLDQRIDPAFLFTQLGSASLAVFIVITISVFAVLSISVYFLIQMWREKLSEPRKHPKKASVITLYGLSIIAILLLWIASFYSPVSSFWMATSDIFNYFMQWDKIGFILWISAALSTIIFHIIRKKWDSRITNIPRSMIYRILILMHVIGIVFVSLNIISLVSTDGPIIWPFVSVLFAGGSVLTFLPDFIDYYKNHLQPRIEKVDRPLVAKVTLISVLLLIPYAYYFWFPFVSSVPSVDLPFQSHMVNINGVDVPFQNDIAYPSFETQNITPLSISGGQRYALNLSGEWKWKHTSENYPDYNLLMRTPAVMEIITETGYHIADYDDDSWDAINIPRPNCFPYWEGSEDDERYGTFWYRKTFDVPSVMDDHQLMLKFFGGGYIMDIWLNGTYVGYHEITHNGFVFDVTDLIEPGKEHVLAIRVVDTTFGLGADTAFRTKRVPPSGDNFGYGGLTREIWLEALPVAHIVRTDIKMLDYNTTDHLTANATIQADVTIRCPIDGSLAGTAADLTLTMYPLVFQRDWTFDNNTHFTEIYDANLTNFRNTWEFANHSVSVMTPETTQITLTGSANTNYTTHRFNFNLENVDLWSTKNPSLYAIYVNLTTLEYLDSFCTQTGFRNFTTDGQKFMLNGAEVKLPGVAFHEEMWDPYGSSVRDWQMIYKLMRIKGVNANFARMGQYPMHPNWYLFAERMGLAMWAEEPLTWLNEIHFTKLLSRDGVDPLLINLIYPNINRPGILFWGGPNEPWAGDDFVEFVKLSNEFVMEYDNTRLYSFAAVLIPEYYRSWKNNDDLKVLSPNNYAGTHSGERGEWYEEVHKSMDEFEEELGEENYNHPVIIMEYGYWHEDWKGDDAKHDNQMKCLNESVTAYLEMGITSFTWFTVFDYIGFQSTGGWYSSGFGVYSLDGWTRYDPVANMMRNIYGNITLTNL